MTEENKQNLQFVIQRIYLKDASLESPLTPKVFLEKDWNPEIDVELNTKSVKLEDGVHEVVLMTTVSAKQGDETAFLAEVHQAGVFILKGLEGEGLHRALGSFCPNILFPYAREVVTDLVQRGGFPPLYLAPVNFDALYEQHRRKTEEAKGDEPKKAANDS